MPNRVNDTPAPDERTPAPPALRPIDRARVLVVGPGLALRVLTTAPVAPEPPRDTSNDRA